MQVIRLRIFCAMLLTINPAQSMFPGLEGMMTTVVSKPLLTRADLPLDAIAEICRRWGVVELAIDTTQCRPPPTPSYYLENDPFELIDLYLIADFGPGKRRFGAKKHHYRVVDDLYELLGSHVWIYDKESLENHVADGREWAQQELDARDVIYAAE